MNHTLFVKLGIRAKAGRHNHFAVDVRDIYVVGSLALTNHCLLQSQWCGNNTRIILTNAIFV